MASQKKDRIHNKVVRDNLPVSDIHFYCKISTEEQKKDKNVMEATTITKKSINSSFASQLVKFASVYTRTFVSTIMHK